ncbi:MAG: NAD-dependent epimerase/dehydratase family protein [Caldilineaceae bacterium]
MSHEVIVSPTALVTGAAGRLGPPLVRALAARGYRVRALVRKRLPAGLLPPAVEVVYANVDQPQTVAPALAGCNLIFHVAAVWAPGIADAPTREHMWRTNVAAVAALAPLAQQQGVARLIFFSTAQVYGQGDGQTPATEETPVHPLTTFAQTKRAAEQIVLNAQNPQQMPLAVVLRLAPLCGGAQRAAEPGASILCTADAIQGALLAAEAPQAAGQIYNLGSRWGARARHGAHHAELMSPGPRLLNRNRPWWRLGRSTPRPAGAAGQEAPALIISHAKAARELGYVPVC